MVLEVIIKTLTGIFTVFSSYLFIRTVTLGASYIDYELSVPIKIGLLFFFIGISSFKVPYVKNTLYALAYSYAIYKLLHMPIAVEFAVEQLKINEDHYLKSPIIGIVAVILSSLITGLVPLMWRIGTKYLEYGAIAKQAGLFLSQKQAHHVPISHAFQEYMSSIKEIRKLKFKCITGYHTFAADKSLFKSIFDEDIDISIDKIEILLANPEGEGIRRRAKIIARSEQKHKTTVLRELQDETKNTLRYLNDLPYKEKINVKFSNDDEARYKILLFNQVVLVQGYFGSQDIKSESIYGFKEIEKTTSMYKLFQKLFDEKFECSTTIKIHNLSPDYHLFYPMR